jgi:hypothetical protein
MTGLEARDQALLQALHCPLPCIMALFTQYSSRLAASPHGKRLLSAGWVWHPWSAVLCLDVRRALAEPDQLDHGDHLPYSKNVCLAEESSACWLDDDRIVVAASSEPEEPQDSNDAGAGPRLLPQGLAVYDLSSRTCLRAFQFEEPPGTILAIGTDHALSLYRHPKLIDLSTGNVLHVWTELHSGLQDSSIVWALKEDARPPPMALDPASNRFAIVNRDTVTVIEFNHSALSSR